MRAVIAKPGPDRVVIDDVPEPVALAGEDLVRVHAAALNPIDERIVHVPMWRRIYGHQLPVVLGHDSSGVIESAPAGSRFAIGDEVYARPHERRIGTLAPLIAVREEEVARKPSKLTHEQAASIPLVGLTAWQALVERAQ